MNWLLHLDIILSILQLAKCQHSVALKAMHELMGHDAVRAEEVGTIETTSNSTQFLALASSATYAWAI